MWRYRMRSWSRDSIHRPEWSRQEEKEMSGLVISQGCGQGRNAEGTYKWRKITVVPFPNPHPHPKKDKVKGLFTSKTEPCKTQLRAGIFEALSMTPTLSPSLSFLCYFCTQCTFFFHWPLCVMAVVISPRSLPPQTLWAPLKNESYTCAPVFLSGTWWTHKNSYWNELG